MFSWFSLAGIELGMKIKPILTVNNITIRLQILAYFRISSLFLTSLLFLDTTMVTTNFATADTLSIHV